MKNPLFENTHPFTKIVFLSFITIVSIFILFSISLLISTDSVASLKILAAFQHLLLFIIPAVVAAYLYSKSVKEYLFVNKTEFSLIILAFLVIIFAIPLINYTAAFNAKLSLPESLSGIEKIIKDLESAAKVTTNKILDVNSVGGLIVNIIIIAILPAIGEELIFRGMLLRLFKEWFKNMHVAIIVSAFFFSFIHFQFYGFIPRMLLGILFGYLLYWSGSILLPILAHFINNATAVLFYYFIGDAGKVENTEEVFIEPIALVPSLVLFGIFLFLFYKSTRRKETIPDL